MKFTLISEEYGPELNEIKEDILDFMLSLEDGTEVQVLNYTSDDSVVFKICTIIFNIPDKSMSNKITDKSGSKGKKNGTDIDKTGERNDNPFSTLLDSLLTTPIVLALPLFAFVMDSLVSFYEFVSEDAKVEGSNHKVEFNYDVIDEKQLEMKLEKPGEHSYTITQKNVQSIPRDENGLKIFRVDNLDQIEPALGLQYMWPAEEVDESI
jgi:hypothetical protein